MGTYVADVLTKSQRSFCMSRIKASNTKPEMVTRRLLFSQGYRYRLHVHSLPGTPDIVFPRQKKIIFVHGCFWHRHRCRFGSVTPKSRVSFWKQKLLANKGRDSLNRLRLKRAGWRVMVVWECQTSKAEKLIRLLDNFLLK
jgi:DNA mismatch endonuclease (patch repair protein)